jgi:hypothetical protein
MNEYQYYAYSAGYGVPDTEEAIGMAKLPAGKEIEVGTK